MISQSPKLHLLYYKHILDISLNRFFKDYGKFFTKEGKIYVNSKQITHNKLKRIIREYINEEILNYVEKFDVLTPQYYVIIGSCLPKNNILLDVKKDNYIPEYVMKVVNSNDYNIKYYLKEKDIKIDINLYNDIFEEIFDSMFCSAGIQKYFGNNYSNLIFIKEKSLDCYMMFKCIKSIYGDVNVVNTHKEKKLEKDRAIYSVNEMIDKYVHGKYELLRSDKMDIIKKEIRQYIDGFLFG